MNTKLYVGNLLYECTDEDLRQLFSQFGQVLSAEIVRYKKSHRSKGFGYVRLDSPEAAQQAIQQLNGQDFQGRRLMLAEARSADPEPAVMEELRAAKDRPIPPRREKNPQATVSQERNAFTPIPVSQMTETAPEEPPVQVSPDDPAFYAAPTGTQTPEMDVPTITSVTQQEQYQPEETSPMEATPVHQEQPVAPEAPVAPVAAEAAPAEAIPEAPAPAPAEQHTSLQDHMRAFGNIFSKKPEDK